MVNIDVNLAAAILTLGIIVMCARRGIEGDSRKKTFVFSAVILFIISLLSILLEFTDDIGSYALAVAADTTLEILINLLNMGWFMYILLEICEKEEYLRRRLRLFMPPMFLLICVDIINIFTGLIWYYDAELNYYENDPPYIIYDLFRYAYIFAALIQYLYYRKRNVRMYFFSAWFFVIPLFLGGFVEKLTGYTVFQLGAALAMTMLYMLSANEDSFMDEPTGFYNSYYLSYLYNMIDLGGYELGSILTYEIKEDDETEPFSKKLKALLPDKCDA
ncbi:MAG: hypothetical protein J6N76_01245, partial [Lachnospiraceae bacterium]|nr:hypothetical protein [Lachnospiraceae bacterium]